MQKILKSINREGYIVGEHKCYYKSERQPPIQHDNDADGRLIPLISVFHLGGQKGVTRWVMNCETHLYNDLTASKVCIPMEAVAGDIFLCIARYKGATPIPHIPKDTSCNLIMIKYWPKPLG